MGRVVMFHISGENPEKLAPFYETIFGWHFERQPGPRPFWMIRTGSSDAPGIDGGLHRRQTDNRVVNTIQVDDIDVAIAGIEENGGHLIQKQQVPDVGWVAQFEDPEGNLLGLLEPAQE